MTAAPRPTRRELLRAGAALGGSAVAAQPLVGRALGAASGRGCGGKLGDIEHIVVLMQENRSFDQYFGTFPGVRGFDDSRNRQAFAQPGYTGRGSKDGRLLPFHLDGRAPLGQCLFDPTHDWFPQHQSWNGGANDRFYEAHAQPAYDGPAAPGVMGYYLAGDIPYHWRLAQEFTLCDAYHCSVIGPTEPNRTFAVSASLGADGKLGGPTVATVFDAQGLSGNFGWTTMPEQLSARGITWKSYTQAAGQFDNPFPAFTKFRTDPALNALGIKPVFPDDFAADLARNELPQVSWVQVSFGESEHASFPPARGAYGIDRVLSLIWAHPAVWRKTAVIVNYDENGGFFDHVPPPAAPPGTPGEYLTGATLPPAAGGVRGPIGLGFRVPCMIVSPWSRGGLICSDTFDHTSVLRLIERRFGAEVPNVSEWRRSVTGDLVSAFDFASPPDFSIPKMPSTSNDSPLVTTPPCTEASPAPYPVPATIRMPRQERQRGPVRRPSGACRARPHRPVPPFTG